jgi:hypothetical protein
MIVIRGVERKEAQKTEWKTGQTMERKKAQMMECMVDVWLQFDLPRCRTYGSKVVHNTLLRHIYTD